MKNTDLTTTIANLKPKITQAGIFLQRYTVIIFILIVVSLYGYLILQISNSATREPTETEVLEELSTVKRLKIDQESINKIKALEDQNIQVQSLFQDARDNPFSE